MYKIMSSYWSPTNKIPIEQKSVSIPALNGTNHIPTQEVRFEIPENIKYFNPKDSYLEFDVEITPTFTDSASNACTTTQPCYLTLDQDIGAQSVIRTVRIHDSNGVLLEEIDGYNVMVSVKYDYHNNDSLQGKRALTDLTGYYQPAVRGTGGNTRTHTNRYIDSPFFTQSSNDSTTKFSSTNFLNARVAMPLHTGIFQNDKIFPNGLVGGLRISLLLEDAYRVLRVPDGSMRYRRTYLNPKFGSIDGLNACSTTSKWASDTESDVLYVSPENSMDVSTKLPFAVGEAIGLTSLEGASETVYTFTNAAGSTKVPVIEKYETTASGVKITLTEALKPNDDILPRYSSDDGLINNDVAIYSQSNIQATQGQAGSYTVKNSKLVIQHVDVGSQYENEMMRKMKEGGRITYDFLSATNYKYSQLKGDVVANIALGVNNSRCKSILAVPTDATIYTQTEVLNASKTYAIENNGSTTQDFHLNSNRPGLEGISDYLTEYQWLYAGKLQPSRRVRTNKTSSKESINAQHLIELDKALNSAGITGHSLKCFNKNFIIGRSLSIGDGVYDGRNRDFNLQLNYGGTAPTKDKLWNNFVFHLRRIEITANSVMVVV
jgi:hypothetical protein